MRQRWACRRALQGPEYRRCCGGAQVVDDILDITATTEQLGKTAGKDLASSKTTYPSILGLEQVSPLSYFPHTPL